MTQYGYPTYPPGPPRVAPRNGFGITALVLGIVGALFGLIPFTFFIAFICGVVGLVFGGLGLARISRGSADNKVMSWFGTGLSALAVVLAFVGIVILGQAVEQLDQDLQELGQGRNVGTPAGGSTGPDGAGAPEPAAPRSLGEALLITGGVGGATTAEILASDLRVTEVYTADYGYTTTPANGYFVTVHIEVTNTGDAGFTFNPFNYKVIVGGRQYDYGNGKAIAVGGMGDGLSSGTLAPGASTEGDITFDLPTPHGKLVYAPNFDGVPIGSWSF